MYEVMTQSLRSLFDNVVVKTILAFIFAVFQDHANWILVIVLLMFLDFGSGISASWQRKEKIESLGFRRTMNKVVSYFAFLSATSLVAYGFEELSWIANAAYAFVALTELKSIAENTGHLDFWETIKSKLPKRNE